MQRSNRADVRNPIAGDAEVAEIVAVLVREHPAAGVALERVLRRLSAKWRDQADKAWGAHKGPMAAYHKANAVNARHLALALRGAPVPTSAPLFD